MAVELAEDASVRDTLAAAFNEVEEKDDQGSGQQPAKVPAKDDDGGAGKQPESKGKEPSGDPAKEPAKDDEKEKAERRSRYREPPSRWSKEAKEEWAKTFGEIDPNNPTHKQIGAIRDMMADRHDQMEREHQAAVKELETTRASYKALDDVLAPYKADIERSGVTVQRAVADLMQLNTFATQRPEEFVKWFVGARQLDVSRIFNVQGNKPADPKGGVSDPDDDDPLGIIPQKYKDALASVPQLVNRINQLEGGVNQFTGQFQQVMSQQQQARSAEAVTQIRSWATAKDDDGNLLRPHYEDVKSEMIWMLENPQVSNVRTLDEAYAKATRLNNDVWQRIQDSESARQAAQRAERERTRTNAARAAAVSLSGRPGGAAPVATPPPGQNEAMSVRQSLEAAFAAAENRGTV